MDVYNMGRKNVEKKRFVKERIIIAVITLLIVTVGLIGFFGIKENNEKILLPKNLPELPESRKIHSQEDLYYPVYLEDENFTVYLSGDLWCSDAGLSDGYLRIYNTTHNYDRKSAISPNEAGGSVLYHYDDPIKSGNYTFEVEGKARIMLIDNAIKDILFQHKLYEGKITRNITSFYIDSSDPVDLTISVSDGSLQVYIYDHTLSLICSDYVNRTTKTFFIPEDFSFGCHIVLVSENVVGSQFTVSYREGERPVGIDPATTRICALGIMIIAIVMGAYLFKLYKKEVWFSIKGCL
jgi:hypothetical protein